MVFVFHDVLHADAPSKSRVLLHDIITWISTYYKNFYGIFRRTTHLLFYEAKRKSMRLFEKKECLALRWGSTHAEYTFPLKYFFVKLPKAVFLGKAAALFREEIHKAVEKPVETVENLDLTIKVFHYSTGRGVENLCLAVCQVPSKRK